ncbi:hypothetical protein ACJRO7_020101 [Eucalyptus globulus]|uniref:Subtilisin-like protease SBT1.1 n=1 Tax=Eucalyptus globulus TaxID=34317 RepID=A0ABD3KKK8_EUCGL
MTSWTLLSFLAFLITTANAAVDTKTYIVHMDNTRMAQPSNIDLGGSKQWYESILESIAESSSSSSRLLYVYETAIAGFAAKLSSEQLRSLTKVDGFLSATEDELLTLHTTHSPQFLGLRNGRGLWEAAELNSDVIVGVLDTGIWPEHVSFRDTGMPAVPSRWKGACEGGTNFSSSNCNRKLIGARAFFKGYESVVGKINETTEYRSPRDRQGHGSHTASTAAGNCVKGASLFGLALGSATGMKNTARIAVYKVCWRLGCANSDILAAMDRATLDGVDVLSLSLGGLARPFYTDNIAVASFSAVQRGIFVACSAGNSGPSPSTVSNAAPWIMTVAASYIDRSFPTKVKLGDGQTFEGSSLYSGKPTDQLPLVYRETAGGKGAEYCTAGTLDPKLVNGKIVICDRGVNGRTDKGQQVKLAGGAAMIMLNTENQGEETLADAHILPATSVGASAAKAIKQHLNSSDNPTASISFRGTVFGYRAPVMAAFSSRGPSLVDPEVIKPDVTAPGVNILAAWTPVAAPSLLTSDNRSVLFNIISGTSMSCPHISGLAALLKSVHKDWSPAAIKSALMTTSYTVDNRRAPISDISSGFKAATPFAFGSGHVDPERASNPGLIYDISTVDYLNHLCSLKYNSSQIALFAKTSYTCPRSAHPGDLNYPSFAVLFKSGARNASITHKRTATNVGCPVSRYQVLVDEPDGVSVIVKPRNLVFGKLGEKQSYRVTFVALGGSSISSNSSFGSITWFSGKYIVRSPIAVSWN